MIFYFWILFFFFLVTVNPKHALFLRTLCAANDVRRVLQVLCQRLGVFLPAKEQRLNPPESPNFGDRGDPRAGQGLVPAAAHLYGSCLRRGGGAGGAAPPARPSSPKANANSSNLDLSLPIGSAIICICFLRAN